MKEKYELDRQRMQARNKAADWEAGQGRSIIILRADKDCNYKMVHDVMEACKKANYERIQLRAIQAGSLGTGN
jgi:biopolymer transport protein ExbD